jgi:hypothetical protein
MQGNDKLEIVFCTQNQMLRRIPAIKPNISLCVVGVHMGMALTIKADNGNLTLAHLDTKTDLNFIDDEISWMKSQGAIACEVTFYTHINQQLLKGKIRIGKGTMNPVRLDDCFQTYQSVQKHYENKALPNIKIMTSDVLVISPNNTITFPTSGYIQTCFLEKKAQSAAKSSAAFQMQVYERQLMVAFSNEMQKPTLTFDGQGFIPVPGLDDKVKEFVLSSNSEAERSIVHFCEGRRIPIDTALLESVTYVIPRYKALTLDLAENCKLNGNASYGRKAYLDAIIFYKEALTLNPRFKEVLHNTGMCHYFLKEYESAIAFFNKALEIDPKYENAKTNKARAEAALEKSMTVSRSKTINGP